MSKEHEDALVWDTSTELDAKLVTAVTTPYSRQYQFSVQRTTEKSASVSMHDGFLVCSMLPE